MSELPVTVYTPDSAVRRPATLLRDMIVDLKRSRHLGWQLARRDVAAQYRQALLGLLWAFLLPLANAGVWIFLSRSGVVSFQESSMPYVAFVASGTIFWAIFTDALNAPLQQTRAATGILMRLNFPREALLVSGVIQTLCNALIKLAALLLLLLVVGMTPHLTYLLIPIGATALVIVGTALGLMIAPLGALYDDVARVVPLLLQFLMYVTPVVFPIPRGGWASKLFTSNPLCPLFGTLRSWILGGPTLDLGATLLVTGAGCLLVCFFWLIYRIAIPIIVERMGA